MSDEVYDADGDVSRYLRSPGPEPHHLFAVPDDAHVATHVVGPQQHLPPLVDHAPMMLNPAQAAGFAAPAVDAGQYQAPADLAPMNVGQYQAPAVDVDRYQAPTAMDIQQPPQMVADPEQAYGFLEPPLAEAATGLDGLPSFEGMLEGVPPVPGSPSLRDMSMRDGQDELAAVFKGMEVGNAVVEPDARPAEEDFIFVPFVRGQLDCTNCRTVREVLHESANHKFYLIVHGTDHGTFHHAIIDRTYIGADGQTTTNELMYLDLQQRTHNSVQNFMESCMVQLRNDNSGQLKDSWSYSQKKKDSWSTSCAAASSNMSTPPVNNDAHMNLEFDMLKKIISSHVPNDEAVQPRALEAPRPITVQDQVEISQDDDISNAANWSGLNHIILESSVQDGESSANNAAEHPRWRVGQQRKRLSNMSMVDTIDLLHMSKEDAAKQLKISSSSLRRLCRKNDTDRWPARRIKSIDNKIKKLEETSLRNAGTKGLLAIKEKMDKLQFEKAQLYASIMKAVRENEMKKGAGPSGTK